MEVQIPAGNVALPGILEIPQNAGGGELFALCNDTYDALYAMPALLIH